MINTPVNYWNSKTHRINHQPNDSLTISIIFDLMASVTGRFSTTQSVLLVLIIIKYDIC